MPFRPVSIMINPSSVSVCAVPCRRSSVLPSIHLRRSTQASFVVRYMCGGPIGAPPRRRPEDIQHGLRNALVVEEIGEDPTRYLVLGPGRDGQLLELVVMDRPRARW